MDLDFKILCVANYTVLQVVYKQTIIFKNCHITASQLAEHFVCNFESLTWPPTVEARGSTTVSPIPNPVFKVCLFHSHSFVYLTKTRKTLFVFHKPKMSLITSLYVRLIRTNTRSVEITCHLKLINQHVLVKSSGIVFSRSRTV